MISQFIGLPKWFIRFISNHKIVLKHYYPYQTLYYPPDVIFSTKQFSDLVNINNLQVAKQFCLQLSKNPQINLVHNQWKKVIIDVDLKQIQINYNSQSDYWDDSICFKFDTLNFKFLKRIIATLIDFTMTWKEIRKSTIISFNTSLESQLLKLFINNNHLDFKNPALNHLNHTIWKSCYQFRDILIDFNENQLDGIQHIRSIDWCFEIKTNQQIKFRPVIKPYQNQNNEDIKFKPLKLRIEEIKALDYRFRSIFNKWKRSLKSKH